MMLKRNIINQKYLAIAGSVILLVICYELAFKNTMFAYKSNQQLKSQLSQSIETSAQPGYLKRKDQNLDSLLNRYQSDSLSLRGNTLAAISLAASKYKVRLSEVPVYDPALSTNQFIIEKLKFDGNYIDFIKVLDQFEKMQKIGVARSVILKRISKDNLNSTSSKLVMEILLESKKY